MTEHTSAQDSSIKPPRGFSLLRVLRGHDAPVWGLTWSPDGRMIASNDDESRVRVWDTHTGERVRTFEQSASGDGRTIWSPGGDMFAAAFGDKVRLWDAQTWEPLRTVQLSEAAAGKLSWSPDGRKLFCGRTAKGATFWDPHTGGIEYKLGEHATRGVLSLSPDWRMLAVATGRTISLHDPQSGQLLRTVEVPETELDYVDLLSWMPDGQTLASVQVADAAIHLWDAHTGRAVRVLEGHTHGILALRFSPDGRLLASNSYENDSTVRLWRCDTWEQVAVLDLKQTAPGGLYGGLAFHPSRPVLATRAEADRAVYVWELDVQALLGGAAEVPSTHYTNAKVVLVGEQSTGKTCLARALMGEEFVPQESTHGMKVWSFHTETVGRDDGGQLSRETMLWDLAGQVDYQVVHQLFLDETALGVVLFDPSDPAEPFGGVGHWEKALRRVAGEDCQKVLVAGRVDRGYPAALERDIRDYCREHGFAEYVATSAKTGEGVERLRGVIARLVPWERLPVTSSPELWKQMREYLLRRRAGEEVLTLRAELRGAFRRERPEAEFGDAEFDTVIRHAQAQGLLWRLSFGDFVLLKPELLNDYASAVVRAARKHPQGLGSVVEREVLEARVNFEDLPRLADPATERSLLHAVVELFLKREVALREGEHLVFPSKFNRKHPEFPRPPRREVAYKFAGAVEDLYATLAVRLFYCGAFELKDLWKNAAEFHDAVGRVCGVVLESADEGQGTLSIFFGEGASPDSKVLFLRFVHEHLQRRALAGSVARERVYRCPACGEEVENRRAVQVRLERGLPDIPCQFCETKIKLFDLLEEKFGDPALLRQVRELEKEAEERREREVGLTTARAKEVVGEFDVFLAHNSRDKPQVKAVADELKKRGLSPWLDVEQVAPGRWFQDVIQKVIPQVKSAAVFIGPRGFGKWQALELRAFISQCVESDLPVIPVLLPGVAEIPAEFPFLRELNWIRFARADDAEALDALQWGITGERPRRGLELPPDAGL